MKTLLQLLMTGLVLLLTQGFAQEPMRAVAAKEPVGASAASREQVIATGTEHRPAAAIEPKALPVLSPSLGEIARAARAAHAAAPKAQVVVADDAPPPQK